MSIEQHIQRRQRDLAHELAPRAKVYLDMCAWIALRSVVIEENPTPAARKLLHHLRRGVAGGHLICPISAPMFMELLKQYPSPGRRIATTELIDTLSLGVAMVPNRNILTAEVRSFLQSQGSNAELYYVPDVIWTRTAYVLGTFYPAFGRIPDDIAAPLQAALFDTLWDSSLISIVKTIGDTLDRRDAFRTLSDQINRDCSAHQDDIRSFAAAYDIELRGIVEVAGTIALDCLAEQARAAGHQESLSEAARAETLNMCRNLLYHAISKPGQKQRLRSIHIGATLHASMRLDKARKFKANDLYDFEHATAALAYCDLFITEGPLMDMATRPQARLEMLNPCAIFSDVGQAADHVRDLLRAAERARA